MSESTHLYHHRQESVERGGDLQAYPERTHLNHQKQESVERRGELSKESSPERQRSRDICCACLVNSPSTLADDRNALVFVLVIDGSGEQVVLNKRPKGLVDFGLGLDLNHSALDKGKGPDGLSAEQGSQRGRHLLSISVN
jgi:hypothetical protein